MKKIILFTITFVSFALHSQTKVSDVQKDKQIGLVWGLMKYHHPEISEGKYNWDGVFLELMANGEKIETQEKINIFLLDFVKKYNTKKRVLKNENLIIQSFF